MILQPARWLHLVRHKLRSFSAPLCTQDGGLEPLDSTFLRGQSMVDHVTHHEMEQEKRRRHLELQEFTRKQTKEKDQAPQTEQEQKSTSARRYCNSDVGDDPNELGTKTHSEKSKIADHASRDSSLVDEGSLTSDQVVHSAKPDRRRRHSHKSSKTRHHGQHSRSRYRHNHHRRRDICDTDSYYDDGDTDRYRKLRSSLDGKKPYYEPRQRRLPSPSVVRDRYRGKGRRRQSRSHTNSYDDSKSRYQLRRSDNDVHDRHRNHETPTYNTAPDNATPTGVPPMKSQRKGKRSGFTR